MPDNKRLAKNTKELLDALSKLDAKEDMARARQALEAGNIEEAAATLAALAFANKPVYDQRRCAAYYVAKRYLSQYGKTPEETLKRLVPSPIAWKQLQQTLGIQ